MELASKLINIKDEDGLVSLIQIRRASDLLQPYLLGKVSPNQEKRKTMMSLGHKNGIVKMDRVMQQSVNAGVNQQDTQVIEEEESYAQSSDTSIAQYRKKKEELVNSR